jgi:hypothetical protein
LDLLQSYTEQHSPYVDDGEPWHHLKAKGFRQKLGLLKSPVNHRWDDEDREAVQYLCNEWGWTWSDQEV